MIWDNGSGGAGGSKLLRSTAALDGSADGSGGAGNSANKSNASRNAPVAILRIYRGG